MRTPQHSSRTTGFSLRGAGIGLRAMGIGHTVAAFGLLAGGGLICTVLGSNPARAEAAPPAAADGIWQKHELSFSYFGFTSTYSCDGLADKVKILLAAAGARADATVRAGNCASGFGRPDKFARVDLSFYSLAPSATGSATDTLPIEGVWKSVALADHKPFSLATGDCELVEQFKTTVLPLFTTRNMDGRTTCVPHQLAGSHIDLRFDTFTAAPKRAAGLTGPELKTHEPRK